MIYQPAEDSYLLKDVVRDFLSEQNNKNMKILDMGSGSGIQALACKDLGFENVLAVDINMEVVNYLKKKRLNTIESDLFSKIYEDNKFDLIIFNAPYLPEDEREPEDIKLATAAGKKGYEIIIRFLKEAKEFLNENGQILLLFSSLSQPKIILNKANELGYNMRLLVSQMIPFEKLFVYEFKK